jgi:hypothetical protein
MNTQVFIATFLSRRGIQGKHANSNEDTYYVLDYCCRHADAVHTIRPQWIRTMTYTNLDTENTKLDFVRRVNYIQLGKTLSQVLRNK